MSLADRLAALGPSPSPAERAAFEDVYGSLRTSRTFVPEPVWQTADERTCPDCQVGCAGPFCWRCGISLAGSASAPVAGPAAAPGPHFSPPGGGTTPSLPAPLPGRQGPPRSAATGRGTSSQPAGSSPPPQMPRAAGERGPGARPHGL